MKLAFLRIPKEMALRSLAGVIGLEVLLFLLPTAGKVEGFATDYWGGVRLRLSSGKYWAIALLSGIGAYLLLHALLVFSSYLARVAKPPSGGNEAAGPDKRSS